MAVSLYKIGRSNMAMDKLRKLFNMEYSAIADCKQYWPQNRNNYVKIYNKL